MHRKRNEVLNKAFKDLYTVISIHLSDTYQVIGAYNSNEEG